MVALLNNPDSSSAWDSLASDYPTEIIKRPQVGQSKHIGSIEDISALFRNRYEKIKKIFREQSGFRETGTIRDITNERKKIGYKKRRYNIIGIVEDFKRTKSGGKLVTLEDPTGTMRIFIRKKTPHLIHLWLMMLLE